MKLEKIPSIFLYLDCRHYLTDVFTALKKANTSFSYRTMGRLAGSSSPNFLQLITSRKLNISNSQVVTLAGSLRLNKKEEAYFRTIVAFDHAKTHQEKDIYFQKILVKRECESIKVVEKKQYDYFAHWYNPVVRELLTHPDYPDTPEWISDRIIPKISPGKVRKSIDLLVSLGLIQRNDTEKRWEHTDRTITTPSEVLSMAVIKYHQSMITIARDAIENFKPSQRDIRAITMGVSKEGYQELKKRMESFWKEMLTFADNQKRVDEVIQLNIQLFPFTTPKEKE